MAEAEQVGTSSASSVSLQNRLQQVGQYLAQELLNGTHYKKLYLTLPQCDGLQSLSAALKLMERYGMQLPQSEVEMLSSMDEMRQISHLVSRMPVESQEHFQDFFMQLQLLVATATRIRQALREGRSDLVEAALDEAEGLGISQYILRMAMAQSGIEVSAVRQAFEACVAEWEQQMTVLMRGQEDNILARTRLAAAKEQLVAVQAGQNERFRKVLLSMTTNETVILANVVGAWSKAARRLRQEDEVRREFEGRIEAAEAKLLQFQTEHLRRTLAALGRQAEEADSVLLADAIAVWQEYLEDERTERQTAMQVLELEARLREFKELQSDTALKVLMRMQEDEEAECVRAAFQAWTTHMVGVRQARDAQKAVDVMEQKVAAFIQERSENAMNLLQNMTSGTATGLLSQAIKAWLQVVGEGKKEQEHKERWQRALDKIEAIESHCKSKSFKVLGSAADAQDQLLLVKLLHEWRRCVKIDKFQQGYMNKYEGKRQQLASVQKMFRDFATKMEKFNDADSGRNLEDLLRKRDGGSRAFATAQDGSWSLPDIHKVGSAQSQKMGNTAAPGAYARGEAPKRPTSAAARSSYPQASQVSAPPSGAAAVANDRPEVRIPPRSAWS
mmetsp:Transcript_13146/g.30723  ORF Transcript_13146/g.30723 Transcript_13146/m.30723 type:complete len:616 (-) Transcript_13146:67-1914(-)